MSIKYSPSPPSIIIYSAGATLETIVTHPIEVIRTRFINHTSMWRGVRGIYPGVLIQLAGMIPNRVVFIGTKDNAIRMGYKWWQYSPVATLFQTLVSLPFQAWKTARIEGIPLRMLPSGFAPLMGRNLIFSYCFFGAKDEMPKAGCTSSLFSTVCGVTSGILLSQPLDVIRVARQSIDRDKSYKQITDTLLQHGKKNGYLRTFWRGCLGRLAVACIGISVMVESTSYLMNVSKN